MATTKFDKNRQLFNRAYAQAFGSKWEWHNPNGTQRHPMIDGTEADRHFYMGFRAAKVTQKEHKDVQREVDSLKRQLAKLEALL